MHFTHRPQITQKSVKILEKKKGKQDEEHLPIYSEERIKRELIKKEQLENLHKAKLIEKEQEELRQLQESTLHNTTRKIGAEEFVKNYEERA